MKSHSNEQDSDKQICVSHDWQPLFDRPHDAKQYREYMVNGYADLMQCPKCGAGGMADGSATPRVPRRVYLFSDSAANSKKRIAVVWNAKQAEAVRLATDNGID